MNGTTIPTTEAEIARINEMIFATLQTKWRKAPKYREELEAAGLELVDQHGMSAYDYWAVKKKDGRTILVISTTYKKQRALFDAFSYIKKGNDMERVNCWDLLQKRDARREAHTETYRSQTTKVEKYLRMKAQKARLEQSVATAEKTIQTMLSDLQESKDRLAKINERLKALFKAKK